MIPVQFQHFNMDTIIFLVCTRVEPVCVRQVVASRRSSVR
jgi:hypothetical protein